MNLSPSHVSKKLINKIDSIFHKYGSEFGNLIKDSVDFNQYDDPQIAIINKNLPAVFEAFFSKKNGINEIEKTDIPKVTEILIKKIINNESFSDISLSIGMGGSPNIPTMRTPAYVMSAIKILSNLKKLQESNIISGLPTVRVFKATHLSSELNDYPLAIVKQSSEVTFNLLLQFLEKFFPELSKCFVFDSDKPCSDDFIQELNLQSEFIKNETNIQSEIQQILLMGNKHGGEKGRENALLYAAAHPIYNKSISSEPNNFSAILELGGVPQKIFNRISRQLITNAQEKNDTSTTPIIHAITRSGKIPVYYLAKNGDAKINEEFSKIFSSDNATRADYKEIFEMINKEDFKNFIEEFHQTNKKIINQIEL